MYGSAIFSAGNCSPGSVQDGQCADCLCLKIADEFFDVLRINRVHFLNVLYIFLNTSMLCSPKEITIGLNAVLQATRMKEATLKTES